MALNHKPGVSTATRKRVFDAARQYGYDFSRRGPKDTRGMNCLTIYRKSGAAVGDTPFFSSAADGVAAGCKKEHYDFVIRYLCEDEDMDGQVPRRLDFPHGEVWSVGDQPTVSVLLENPGGRRYHVERAPISMMT